MKRAVLAGLVVVAILLGVGSAAQATPGTSAGSGDVTVTVQDVWIWDALSFPNGAQTRDIDCPSGSSVVTGYGIWVTSPSMDATRVAGSALDSDTWRVSFSNQSGSSINSVLQVHATCA